MLFSLDRGNLMHLNFMGGLTERVVLHDTLGDAGTTWELAAKVRDGQTPGRKSKHQRGYQESMLSQMWLCYWK